MQLIRKDGTRVPNPPVELNEQGGHVLPLDVSRALIEAADEYGQHPPPHNPDGMRYSGFDDVPPPDEMDELLHSAGDNEPRGLLRLQNEGDRVETATLGHPFCLHQYDSGPPTRGLEHGYTLICRLCGDRRVVPDPGLPVVGSDPAVGDEGGKA